MTPIKLFKYLEKNIQQLQSKNTPVIVGINGVDGSGKTMFSTKFTAYLVASGHDVLLISIDNFHHSKKHRYKLGEISPYAYYYDSINYDAFIKGALFPITQAVKFPSQVQVKSFDLKEDKEDVCYKNIDKDTIVIVEGIFLFRPEMAKYLDFKIFLDVGFDHCLDRMILRDVEEQASEIDIKDCKFRSFTKYTPGQKLYFKDVDPQAVADIVIDNNDFDNPYIS